MKKKFFLLLMVLCFSFTIISFAQENSVIPETNKETYELVSPFSGSGEPEEFTNTKTNAVSIIMNYGLMASAIAIVVLVIVKITQGAVLKGTSDNIYNTTKGNSIIKNAGLALILFIFTYAILSFINPKLTGWNLNTNFVGNSLGNYSGNTNNNNKTCNPNAKYPSDYNAQNPDENTLIKMLMYDEGNKTKIYPDATGNPSIGVGFNLNRDSAAKVKQDLMAAGISADTADKLIKGDKTVEITTAQIQKLLENDMAAHKKMAIDYAGGQAAFDSHTKVIQNILINMTFNMGSGGINTFTNLKKALDEKEYYNVAKEIVNSQYCGQVGDRCSRLANLASSTYCQDVQKKANDSGSVAGGPKITGDTVTLAKRLLGLVESGKVTTNISTRNESDPSHTLNQIKAWADGSLATPSQDCNNPKKKQGVGINSNILSFLIELSNSGKYNINSLSNYCHSNDSAHYSGLAVDLGCTGATSPANIRNVDAIAAKYGIKRWSGETCDNSKHWHYSTTGK